MRTVMGVPTQAGCVRILMRAAMIAGLLFTGLLVMAGSADAQQTICARKVRHTACHFPDGKLVAYDTDAASEFYNISPYMTFRTADGVLHSIIGNCEISCRP